MPKLGNDDIARFLSFPSKFVSNHYNLNQFLQAVNCLLSSCSVCFVFTHLRSSFHFCLLCHWPWPRLFLESGMLWMCKHLEHNKQSFRFSKCELRLGIVGRIQQNDRSNAGRKRERTNEYNLRHPKFRLL